MPKIDLNTDENNLVAGHYSQSRGPVLRSDRIELTKVYLKKGEGARTHQHPEEQIVYVLEGRVRVTVGEETYELGPGEASFHPSNVPHSSLCLEDSVGLSFKNLVDPSYPATGQL